MPKKSEKSCQLAALLMHVIKHNPDMDAPLQTALLASSRSCQENGGSLPKKVIPTQTYPSFFNPHLEQASEMLRKAAQQDPKTYRSAFQTVKTAATEQEVKVLMTRCPI